MRRLARKCTFPIAALVLMGLIAALAWWVDIPTANAQVPPHVFKGKVVIDGRPAPDGTLVVALIDGNKRNKVGEAKTQRGTFRLVVHQPSGQVLLRKTVNFYGETPDGKQFPFPQTARWQSGGETSIALEVGGVSITVNPPVNLLAFEDDFEGFEDFEGEWSNREINADYVDIFTEFLGRFGNETIRLILNDLPAHTAVDLHFDLYLLDSWDGDNQEYGPDYFRVGSGSSLTNLLNETFSSFGTPPNPAYQAASFGTNLGFNQERDDTIYRNLNNGFSFAHTGHSLILSFSGSGLQDLQDESWGIDNVQLFLVNADLKAGVRRPRPDSEPRPAPISPVREQQLPAAVVSGKVIFDGRPVEDGTKVTAHIDGVRISGTRTRGGTFRLVVSQTSGQSFAGRPVHFSGNTPQGSRISWPQTVVWKPGEISITLQADLPRQQKPPAHVFEGKAILDGRPAEDGTQVTAHIDGVRISGTRTRGGRFRLVVPQPLGQSFAGRLVEFRGRTTQDRRIDWLKSAVWRGGESSITLGPEVRYPSGQPRPDQPQGDRARQEEQLRLERDRLEQERRLQEERARLDQERDRQEQLRIEQEFAQREERLRRELEGRNSVTQDQSPPRTESEPSQKGRTRGFFTNSQVGQLGNVNTSVDPTMLAVIGILLTLGATTLQLFRGN